MNISDEVKVAEADRKSNVLISIARNASSYNNARNRITTRLSNLQGSRPLPLTDHLARKIMTLQKGWTSLDFVDSDWQNLARVEQFSDSAKEALNDLLLQYLVCNRKRVNRLIDFEKELSNELLSGKATLKNYDSLGLDLIDMQSLIVFRVKGAGFSADHQRLLNSIRDIQNSSWVRTKFRYPFVYHSVNLPTESYLDTFLSYVVPQDTRNGLERRVMRHLLRDDLSIDYSLEFKVYLSLMCHPFDALDALCTHIEIEIARDGELSREAQRTCSLIGDEFPNSRLHDLTRKYPAIVRKAAAGFVSEGNESQGARLPVSVVTQIETFVSTASEKPDGSAQISEWQALLRMRWSRYPEVKDFQTTTIFGRLWWFLDVGRLFTALSTSMYMLPRRGAVYERRELFRLAIIVGNITPYIVASPRGEDLFAMYNFRDNQVVDEEITQALSSGADAQDRTWFHYTHWRLRKPRNEIRVREWLSITRSSFPVAPSFLTGIDWVWIDEVLPSVRIAPFSASADGPYVLLLRDIEEAKKDTTILRTAIERFAHGKTCETFVEWLLGEYQEWAVAFVRFFLTPENIMLLELAPNMMAALSDRIAALKSCAAKFEFGPLLSEQQMQQELHTLTSTLMLLNVNANQFEVPWEQFKQDAADRLRDDYIAYKAMRSVDAHETSFEDSRAYYAHRYANGQAVHYSFRRSQAPASLILFGVVDAFLDHPTYGIEAILSTRFRHDTFRREFVSTFLSLKNSSMPGIVPLEKNQIIEVIADDFLFELDAWLLERMQTLRPGMEKAIFDFTFKQDELTAISEQVEKLGTLQEILTLMVKRLSIILEDQLKVARLAFSDDFKLAAIKCVRSSVEGMPQRLFIDAGIVDRVASAVKSSIERRIEALTEWIKTPNEQAQRALTFREITYAVIGRFEQFINEGHLRITLRDCTQTECHVGAEKVRLHFDLISEIVQNCLKYSGVSTSRLKIWPYMSDQGGGFVYSSLAAHDVEWDRQVEGHPYISLSDSLFREGNSGLTKIAAIAASIVGASITVLVERRKRSFHVIIPSGTNGETCP